MLSDKGKSTVGVYILPTIVVVLVQLVAIVINIGPALGCGSIGYSFLQCPWYLITLLIYLTAPLFGGWVIFVKTKESKSALLFVVAVFAAEETVLGFIPLFTRLVRK